MLRMEITFRNASGLRSTVATLELDGPESDGEDCEVFAAVAEAVSPKARAALKELIEAELRRADY